MRFEQSRPRAATTWPFAVSPLDPPQPGKDVAHAGRSRRRTAAHQVRAGCSSNSARALTVGARAASRSRRSAISRQLPILVPEIGGMYAIGAGELLYRAVLREHRHCRHRLAGQQARQVFEQREGCALDRFYRQRQLLRSRSNRWTATSLARSSPRRRQADQFERADALVQLLARACAARRDRPTSTSEPS